MDEEAGLEHDGLGGSDIVGVKDFAAQDKIHIHMHTIFEMRDSSIDEINKNFADAVGMNKKRRESKWGWDRDAESGDDAKPCRWRRYSLR